MSHSPLTVAVAQSDDVDTIDAVAEIIEACEQQLGGLTPKGGLLFAALDYDHKDMLAALLERWPDLQLIGGTSDGEMASAQGYLEDSMTLVLFASETLRFSAGIATGLKEDPRGTTQAAIADARGDEQEAPAMCWIAPDGLTANMTAVLGTLQEQFGAALPILGGTAGDHWQFKTCFQFCNERVTADSIPMLMVYGPVTCSVGVASGWVPIGQQMKVTASSGTQVETLDGRPALDVFEEQFGLEVRDAIAEYPLAVYPAGHEDGEAHYLRAIYNVDAEAKTVILGDELPVGSTIRLSNVERNRILDGARDSMRGALKGCNGETPDVVVVVSCAARKWMLGEKAPLEYQTLKATMAEMNVDVPIIGFYSFGEIGPLKGESRFHNETCVSIALKAA